MRAPEMRAPNVDQDHYYELFKIRRNDESGRGARWLPWVAAVALGVGAAVYWDFASLRERAPEALATVRELMAGVTAPSKVATPPSAESEPIAAPPPDVTPPAQSGQPTNAAPPARSAPPQRGGVASNNAAPVPRVESPSPKAASAPPKDSSPPSQDASPPASPVAKDSSAPPKAASPQAAPDASPSQATQPSAPQGTQPSPSQSTQVQQAAVAGKPVEPETFEPEQAVVVVPGAAPSAAIAIRRRGGLDASTSVVWWTSDGTAVSDKDYVNFGARIEKFAAGEQVRTVHIPIVHDPKRKGRESFYVNMRAGNGKRDDPAQRVEVILDAPLTSDILR